ncbi:50S ribosomal protein L35 [bacterium]|nr:50S ribosomal protein L35 [bacterium]
MPKMRTRKSAQKRFKLTAKKKIKREKAYGSHLLTAKTSKRKRNLRKADYVASSEIRRVKRMLSV